MSSSTLATTFRKWLKTGNVLAPFKIQISHAFCRGMKILYLPPYSPDYNPIEYAFGSFKAYIRSNDAAVRKAFEAKNDDVDEGAAMLTLALIESCTPSKALEWFRFCGYY